MADSIYNSEEYLASSYSVSPLCDDCQLNCQSCEDCECEDQNYDNSCGSCETCLTCETCQDCQTTCEKACQDCQTYCQLSCQQCEACQTTCERNCQTTCESVCQDCQTACEACELTCQGSSCQTTCQSVCQTTCESSCQTTCESSCQDSCELACQDCQSPCQLSCQQCEACQTTCELSCQSACELACQNCQTACELACMCSDQSDQCLECQASCQICNSKQSYCAKSKQSLTSHIGSMPIPTVGAKVRTKDYTDITTYLNAAITTGKWSLETLPTSVSEGSQIKRSVLDTFIDYVGKISGKYLSKTDSKISVSDISTLRDYMDGVNIPDTIPCCETTGYESCITEQCAASKCQDSYQG